MTQCLRVSSDKYNEIQTKFNAVELIGYDGNKFLLTPSGILIFKANQGEVEHVFR